MKSRWYVAALVTVLLGSLSVIGPSDVTAKTVTVLAETGKDIQAAIDSLPGTGGKVIVRAKGGTVKVTKSIVIARNNITLEGEGPGATVLRLASGALTPVIVIGETIAVPTKTVENVVVRNLGIDGNRLGQSSEYDGKKSWLRNNGITLRRARSCAVENVRIRAARSGGLVSELGCSRLIVTDVESTENEFDGLAGYQTAESTFSRLQLHHNGWAGISVDIRFDRNTVSGVITDNGKVGVFMRDSNDNSFSLTVLRSGEHGVFIAEAESGPGTAATGNSFVGCQLGENAGAGIRVNDASCVHNALFGSQLFDNAGGGISEVAPGLLVSVGVVVR